MSPVSAVIAAHNEGRNLADMVSCLLDHTPREGFEIVIVDDGSTDGSAHRTARRFSSNPAVRVLVTPRSGVPAARNLGARTARGSTLVFLDGHCYVPDGWLEPLLEAAAEEGVGMVGPGIADLNTGGDTAGFGATWQGPSLEMEWLPIQGDEPYDVPLLAGGCQLMPREVFERVGGYDEGILRWGSEDLELSFRVWLMGFRNVVQPRTVIHHLFRTSLPFHLDGVDFLHNRLRVAAVHLDALRRERVFDHYRGLSEFATSLSMVLDSDAGRRRRRLRSIRRRDDGAFCRRFGVRIA